MKPRRGVVRVSISNLQLQKSAEKVLERRCSFDFANIISAVFRSQALHTQLRKMKCNPCLHNAGHVPDPDALAALVSM